ncbi:MAG: 3'-5' exonuclease [Rubrivivax sp.]
MAIFPQGLSQIDSRCNAGERRVLHQLKCCLEDDYLVWHDVPIGPRARQPDFVVLSPRWGVLLLEVKDWRRSTLGPATRDAVVLQTPRGPVTVAHPLRQARDYALELVRLMEHDPALVHDSGAFAGRLLFPYGWGVVMASLCSADVAGSDFDSLFPISRTLLRDDLDDGVDAAAFQQRLWGMFSVSYPHTLTLPQRDRIRWHLFPELRLDAQTAFDFDGDGDGSVADHAGDPPRPALPALPDLLQVMDLQQEQIARSLGEGHRVIHGAAGSGKTMILIYRAQFLASSAASSNLGKPILVLCFNRTLADRIGHQLRLRGVDDRVVVVRTFHAWCQDLVRSYQLDLRRDLKGDAYFDALASVVERAVDSGRVPGSQYLALLIDEGHDFQDGWLRIAARMVMPETRSLLVLYDDAQSIYQTRRRKFNFASVGIEARGRTSILRLNYRNTAEVLALAMHCAQQLLAGDVESIDEDLMQRVQPATAGRRGPMPVLISAAHGTEEARLVAERIAAVLAAGVPASEVAVLCRSRALMRPLEAALARLNVAVQSMNSVAFKRFDWTRDSVRLLTLHSAKGLEFRHVFIAGVQALPMPGESEEEALRLLYVGMTRATHELVLAAHGDSAVVQQVRRALQVVQGQFSAAG